MIFGITPSTCSEIINKMLSKVVGKLIRHPMDRVQFPDAEKMEYFAKLIHQCEPKVDDVIGFMDGLLLISKCTSEILEQNTIYSSYQSDTMVNNIIAYGPDVRYFFVLSTFQVACMMG
jgi:hypothetical protein